MTASFFGFCRETKPNPGLKDLQKCSVLGENEDVFSKPYCDFIRENVINKESQQR